VRPQLAAIVRATVLGESISSIAQSADAVGAAVAGSLLRVGSIRQLRLGVLAIDITDPIVTIRNDTVTINRKGTYVTATDQTGRNLLAADATPAPTPTATPQATQSIAAPPPPPPPRPRAIPTQRPQLPAPTAGAVAGPALAASIHGAVFTSSMGTGKAVMDGSKVRKALKADKSRASKNKRGHGHGASDVSGHWVSAGGRSTLDIRAVGPHHRDMQVTYSLASSLGTYTGSLTTGYAGSWSIGGPLDAQVRFDSDDRLTMTTVLGSETFRRH
jgi:hypothetical protein